MFNKTQASGLCRRGTIYRLKRDLIKCRIILKTVVAIGKHNYREIHNILMNLVLIKGLYCLSWLPYRLLTLCFLVIGPIELNEGVEAFSILMTHTSVIMTTLTCIFTDDNLRRIVFCDSSRRSVVWNWKSNLFLNSIGWTKLLTHQVPCSFSRFWYKNKRIMLLCESLIVLVGSTPLYIFHFGISQ